MYEKYLSNTTILSALKQAWNESQPGDKGGHEEGGFNVLTMSGELKVVRWPNGE